MFLIKLNLPYDSTIVLLGIYHRKMKKCVTWSHYKNFHSIYINNSPKLGTTQKSFHGWIVKYHGIPILWNTIEQYRGTNYWYIQSGGQKNAPPPKKLHAFSDLWNQWICYITWQRDFAGIKLQTLNRESLLDYLSGSHLITWTLQEFSGWSGNDMSEIIKIKCERDSSVIAGGAPNGKYEGCRQAPKQRLLCRQPAWKLGPQSCGQLKLNLINNLHKLGNHFIPRAYRKAHSLDLCLSDSKQRSSWAVLGLLTFSSVR